MSLATCRALRRRVWRQRFVEHYNFHRLHSAIGYITPADMRAGLAEAIRAARDEKLKATLVSVGPLGASERADADARVIRDRDVMLAALLRRPAAS